MDEKRPLKAEGDSLRNEALSDDPPRRIAARAAIAPGGGPKKFCILSRKPLGAITRVPRLAKELSENGYDVTVLSMGEPVDELRATTPDVKYYGVEVTPFTRPLMLKFKRRLAKQEQQRTKREEWMRNLWREQKQATGPRKLTLFLRRIPAILADRLSALVGVPWWPVKALFIALPSAILFKRKSDNFFTLWAKLRRMKLIVIVGTYFGILRQIAMTRGFAEKADKTSRHIRFDVVQAHDNYALVAADRLAKRDNAKLIYDAVEISSHRLATDFHSLEKIRERFERAEEARIFMRADAIITVSDGLADWYAAHHHLEQPLVVRNCRYFWPFETDRRLREDCGLAGDDIRLAVWFGGAYPQQGIEYLIDAIPMMADHIHVVIVATALPRWVPFLEELPQRASLLGVGDRLHVLPARGPNDLISYVSGADLGVIPRPSELINNYYSMPNKFLEMVMARLPIAVSKVGDMVDAIHKHGIGDVFDERDLADLAATVERMLEPERYAELRENVMKAAEELNWESESAGYLRMVDRLVG